MDVTLRALALPAGVSRSLVWVSLIACLTACRVETRWTGDGWIYDPQSRAIVQQGVIEVDGPGFVRTYRPVPFPGAVFRGWTEACRGVNGDCELNADLEISGQPGWTYDELVTVSTGFAPEYRGPLHIWLKRGALAVAGGELTLPVESVTWVGTDSGSPGRLYITNDARDEVIALQTGQGVFSATVPQHWEDDPVVFGTAVDGNGELVSVALREEQQVPVLIVAVDFSDAPNTASTGKMRASLYGKRGATAVLESRSRGKYSLVAVREDDGTVFGDRGIYRVLMDYEHPDSLDFDDWDDFAVDLMERLDSEIYFGQFDADGDGRLEPNELVAVVMVAGGPRSSNVKRIRPHVRYREYLPREDVRLDSMMVTYIEGDVIEPRNTLAHEFGHAVWQLPDLYDRDSSSDGIGDWGGMGGRSIGNFPPYMGVHRAEAGYGGVAKPSRKGRH